MRIKKEILRRFEEKLASALQHTSVDLFEEAGAKKARIASLLPDYEKFCNYYFPHYCTSAMAPFHKKLAAKIFSRRKIFSVNAWAREHAKSTHVSLMIALWLKFNGQMKCMLLTSQNEDKAKQLLSDIQAELMNNQRINNDFGIQYKLGSWEDGEFITADNVAFFALGRGQSPRGIRNKQYRPDYIVADDIDDDILVQNPRRINAAFDWLMGALYGALSITDGRFVMVGNIIGKDSVLVRASRVPVAEFTQVNALDEKGRPAWKERYTVADLQERIDTMGFRLSQREYFNNPITEGTVFKQDWFRYKKMLPLSSYDYIVCYTDPSFKSSAKADYKATVSVGIYKAEYHIIKAYIEQTTTAKMIEWNYSIYESVRAFKSLYMYMESNFMQDMLLDEFTRESKSRGYPLPIRGDDRKKPDKFQRIETISPLFERGMVFFNEAEKDNPHMQRLIDQFLMMEKGSKAPDDGPDAVEGAFFILQQKTHQEQPMVIKPRTQNAKYKF